MSDKWCLPDNGFNGLALVGVKHNLNAFENIIPSIINSTPKLNKSKHKTCQNNSI